jgi:hypothetical protein
LPKLASFPHSPLGYTLMQTPVLEGVGTVCSLLERWGLPTAGADGRIARLQAEWPDDGSVSPRWSELRMVDLTALLFLHVKDFMADEDDDVRVAAFRKLVAGPGPPPPANPRRLPCNPWRSAFKRQERLMALMYADRDVTWEGSETPPPGMRGIQLWEDFLAGCPEWGSPGPATVVFSRDTCPGSLRQRALMQTSCCYMQAPNVLVHYLCCLHHGGAVTAETPTMADLTKLKLRHYGTQTLWDLIYEDIGGHVGTFLQQLCSGSGNPEGFDSFS